MTTKHAMKHKRRNQILARALPSPARLSENGPGAMTPSPSPRATLTPRQEHIERLRAKRALYLKLGKHKKVLLIDAKLEPLVREELAQENLVTQVGDDLMWIAGQEKAA